MHSDQVPGIRLGILNIVTHLHLVATLWEKYYYYPHFTDEEIEV